MKKTMKLCKKCKKKIKILKIEIYNKSKRLFLYNRLKI